MPERAEANAEHYRAEAARVRGKADTIRNEAMRQQLLAISHSYEALAATADIMARQRRRVRDS
jgi:hypothetical protein